MKLGMSQGGFLAHAPFHAAVCGRVREGVARVRSGTTGRLNAPVATAHPTSARSLPTADPARPNSFVSL